MQAISPNKLKCGDKVVVISPSDSLSLISDESNKTATKRLTHMGLELSFAKNARELDEFDSSSIQSRVDDLHAAFSDKSVQGIFTAFGGYNSNQLLRYLNWDVVKNNPKVFVGFSDTTALQNAIFAKTGLITYSGPSYSRFGQNLYFDYTLEYFKKCVFSDNAFQVFPSASWSDDWWYENQEERKLFSNNGWVPLNEGDASGIILGANLSTFNLLQGTEYFPDISNSILFLEDDSESKIGNFDRDLQSLIHLPNFNKVRGLIIGRFQNGSGIKIEHLIKILMSKKELHHIPILGNADFGHTDPIITFPIGGEAQMHVSGNQSMLTINRH